MEPEDQAVIDVDSELIDSSLPESIEQWYSAQYMMSLLRLSKADLQKSICKLQDVYGLNLATLRRGAARATEYSQLALDATKLLNAGKFTQLRQLVEQAPVVPSPTASTAIVFVDQHNAIAQTAATVADSNLTQIASFKSGLLNNYRELGRALGKQAAAEVKLGFTEEVKAALSDLQDS
ncbi:MAG: hypothetical protein JGK03_07090 [Microcoleus sp. PH2017_25_DOB_D_A]|uniref:hypothetical protein n=1 Tax=unclassified Microcoleus TaxID=2642155 RepID=UPI001DB0FDCD|nr:MULTISPECIES: hypothetical protein [unclassified Microcoleus]TAE15496.1 MAG: hypothetical protein EAZ94_04360 [Oscillatoriales cyanobacterium]MCC3489259.1 hypothetical protein [Microcoleus sp. PH2017_16_JOR_D_A]MCC3515987.1 hypothetical protein [Microcoleus sp. PH2017_18_LLB_O_A]MCC3533961.1 hypothetical protein [Microcoleus sp. PH2017_25_DOB_D_A]MCC3546095.1 hypothetical protein [Microcoleus sp. PH2017_24_DOB_U_A]